MEADQATEPEDSAPQCLRVSLRGARGRVPVDVFHVALPKAQGVRPASCWLGSRFSIIFM